MIRITDHPNMSTAVYHGRKATNEINESVHFYADLGCNGAYHHSVMVLYVILILY